MEFQLVINNQDDAPNPLERTPWAATSFNMRHSNYKDWGKFARYIAKHGGPVPKNGIRQKLDASTAFWLNYYEHGQSAWSLYGEGTQCRWDTTSYGGIIMGDYKQLKSLDHAQRASSAREALKEYTSWCNGEVYEFSFLPGDKCPHCGQGNNVIGDPNGEWTYGSDTELGTWSTEWYDTDSMFDAIQSAEVSVLRVSGTAAQLAEYHTEYREVPIG
jgi:hypothetical protein